jgi:hypothetical protein
MPLAAFASASLVAFASGCFGAFVAFDSGFFVAFDSGFFVAFACTGFFVDVDAMGFFVGALVGVAVGASVAIDDRSKPNSTGEWSEQRAGDCPSK